MFFSKFRVLSQVWTCLEKKRLENTKLFDSQGWLAAKRTPMCFSLSPSDDFTRHCGGCRSLELRCAVLRDVEKRCPRSSLRNVENERGNEGNELGNSEWDQQVTQCVSFMAVDAGGIAMIGIVCYYVLLSLLFLYY